MERKPVAEKYSFCKGCATRVVAAAKRRASRPSRSTASALMHSIARDSVSLPARAAVSVSARRVNSAAGKRHQDTLLSSGTSPKMRPRFTPARGKAMT